MDDFERISTLVLKEQGLASSKGAKILSFVLRLLTGDFKEENTEKESAKYRKPMSYSPE